MKPIGLSSLLLAASLQAQSSTWRLVSTPLVTVGGENNPKTEFTRIAGLLRLSDGTLVVGDAATMDLRLFGPTGTYLRTIGRQGGGPGEYRSLDWVGTSGDTLIVADWINSRITYLSSSGTVVATLPITARDPQRRFTVIGRLANGDWVVQSLDTPPIEGPQQVWRIGWWVGMVRADASGTVRWLGTFPGATYFLYNPNHAEHGELVGFVPLGANGTATVLPDRVLIGDTEKPVLQSFGAEGTATGTLELPFKPVPWTDADIAPARAKQMAEVRGEVMKQFYSAVFSAAVLPKTKPVFRGIVRGSDGNLWVLPFTTGGKDNGQYLVLDAMGKLLARVDVPAGFQLRGAGSDYVVGVHLDEDGVETVQVLRLVKSF